MHRESKHEKEVVQQITGEQRVISIDGMRTTVATGGGGRGMKCASLPYTIHKNQYQMDYELKCGRYHFKTSLKKQENVSTIPGLEKVSN